MDRRPTTAYEVVVRRAVPAVGIVHVDMVPSTVSTASTDAASGSIGPRRTPGGTMEVPPRLQLVVAHPDDETFGCGSLLLHAVAAGARTSVVCATRGEAGEGDTADLGAVRERELREAARLLGVGRVDLLGFADSGMSGEAVPGSLVGAPCD